MALVPFETLSRVRTSLDVLKVPNESQVSKNMNEMSKILANESLSRTEKMNRFNEELNDYTIFADKVLNPTIASPTIPSPPATTPQTFNALPKTFRENANALMEELKKYPTIIDWDPVSQEVRVKGEALKGSNIVDLIGHVMRSRKTARVPTHSDSFIKTLADLNIPEEFVRNKYEISRFRSYKQGDDINPGKRRRRLIKARQQLASAKREKKRVAREHKWMPI